MATRKTSAARSRSIEEATTEPKREPRAPRPLAPKKPRAKAAQPDTMALAAQIRIRAYYLSLELSPAFPGDKLITVELSRSGSGASFAEPTYRNWEPDRAFAA